VALTHPIGPVTAPDPPRSLTVDNNVIYGEATGRIRRGQGVAPGTASTVLLAAADALLPLDGSNRLIIRDYSANIRQMLELLQELEKDTKP
jgi:hypothetical protein